MSDKDINSIKQGDDGEDRGIPSVVDPRYGGYNRWDRYISGLVFIAAVCVLAYIFWPRDEVSKTIPKVDKEFNRASIAQVEIPQLANEEKPPETIEVDPKPPPEPEQSIVPLEVELRQFDEAAQAEQDAAELAERRRRAPLAFPSDSEGIIGAVNASVPLVPNTEGAGSLFGLDEDNAGLGLSTVADNLNVFATKSPSVEANYLADLAYLAAQGKMIGAVLETAMSSDQPGMVRAITSEALYSEDGSQLLVPKNTRLIGQYQGGFQQGKKRIFVVWDRLITPNGIDVQLESPGTDSLGRAGYSGYVDRHFWEKFGASFLLSIIGAASANTDSDSVSDEVRQQVGISLNRSAEIALENSINLQPTFHKNQGEKIRVFIARDINFRKVLEIQNR